MKVSVFGTGYVGLVQGAVLADSGHQVVCVDIDERKLQELRNGHIPIYEPGLESVVKNAVAQGLLSFTSNQAEAINNSDIIFIAVGTPPDEDGSADLSHVLSVAQTIGNHISKYTVIVDKSTVPVGTADQVSETISISLKARRIAIEFDVVANPEFLKEGDAVMDCQRPARIILGTTSRRAESIMRELYEPFNRNHDKIIVMSPRSAELTKYAANCMLAARISLMNEIAVAADALGADIDSVRQGIGSDPRIGTHFLYAGTGYGGSCFPKDVSAMINTSHKNGIQPFILEAVEARNRAQKRVMFDKVMKYFGHDINGKTFALWGLSFKPNTDDMRDAPSRVLMELLLDSGAKIRAFDPAAMKVAAEIYADRLGLVLCDSIESTLSGSDALIVMTEWKQFKTPDFNLIKRSLNYPAIFDGRNIYNPDKVKNIGLNYFGIGR